MIRFTESREGWGDIWALLGEIGVAGSVILVKLAHIPLPFATQSQGATRLAWLYFSSEVHRQAIEAWVEQPIAAPYEAMADLIGAAVIIRGRQNVHGVARGNSHGGFVLALQEGIAGGPLCAGHHVHVLTGYLRLDSGSEQQDAGHREQDERTKTSNGKVHGRPPAGIEIKHLGPSDRSSSSMTTGEAANRF